MQSARARVDKKKPIDPLIQESDGSGFYFAKLLPSLQHSRYDRCARYIVGKKNHAHAGM